MQHSDKRKNIRKKEISIGDAVTEMFLVNHLAKFAEEVTETNDNKAKVADEVIVEEKVADVEKVA